MERQGHEKQSKHREAVGTSGLSRAPTAHSKSLVKRLRCSPPRDAIPPTPDEYESLKMRTPEVHTNREVVNYNKMDSTNIVKLCEIPCYNSSKE
jgi:hypothetical protein